MPEIVFTTRGEVTIASLPRRIAAGLVSTAFACAVGGLVALGGYSIGWLNARFKRASQWTDIENGRARLGWLGSRPGRVVQNAFFVALEVWTRNLRLPGARLLGLRRVELATGAPVTAKQILIRNLAGRLWAKCFSPIMHASRRETTKLAAIQPEFEELHRRYPDEREFAKAAMQLQREHNASPYVACGPPIAAGLISQLPVLLTPRHQSLPDLLAGIVVAVEPPDQPIPDIVPTPF